MGENICHELNEWASSMSSGKLSIQPQRKEDLQHICKGAMIDIWKYVIKHVHPFQKVQKVKGNLALKHINQSVKNGYSADVDLQDIKAKHDDLMSEISATEVDFNNLVSSIEQAQKNIGNSERCCQIEQKSISECNHRLALLNVYNKFIETKLDDVNQHNDELKSNISKITSHQSTHEDNYYVCQDAGVDINTQCKIKKLSSKQVLDSCMDIEKYVRMNLFKHDFDETALLGLKVELRRRMEEIVSKQSPIASLEAVYSYLSELIVELRKVAEGVDILKDAQRIITSSENVCLPSKENMVQHSVEALLHKKRSEHVRAFLKSHCSIKELEKFEMEINDLEVEFNKLLDSKPGDVDKEAVRLYMLAERKEVGLKSAINNISKELVQLKTEMKLNKQSENELQSKYGEIQILNERIKFNQEIIQTLLREFINNNHQLDTAVQAIKEVQNNIQNGCCSTDQLQNWMERDTESLSTISLANLVVVKDENGAKSRRAFLSVLNDFGGRDKARTQILTEIRFPTHKDFNMLSHHIFVSQQSVIKLQMLSDFLRNLLLKLDTTSASDVQELIEKTKIHDEALVRDLVPLLKKANVAVDNCLDLYCQNTQKAFDNWWEQPAQRVIKYITLDDKSFQEWMSWWTQAVLQVKNAT